MEDTKRPKVTFAIPEGVELWIDEQGTVFIYRDQEAAKEAEEFVSLVQTICKQNNWQNHLKLRREKDQMLGLKRIYELPCSG
ncbi:MAG: hypothetical protein WCC99_00080 [Candidatus Sulfotelmatobacter sp.]